MLEVGTMDDYAKIFVEQLRKLSELIQQRDGLNAEIDKVTQLVSACYNMLSEQDQKNYSNAFSTISEWYAKQEVGLTEAIRNVLQSNPKAWFTPIQIRDRLQQSGFNFSAYISNPLSSVHSVLKRFKDTEVKTTDGINGRQYQWVMRFPRLSRNARMRAFVGRGRLSAVPEPPKFEGLVSESKNSEEK
jgi:hypothetical protein